VREVQSALLVAGDASNQYIGAVGYSFDQFDPIVLLEEADAHERRLCDGGCQLSDCHSPGCLDISGCEKVTDPDGPVLPVEPRRIIFLCNLLPSLSRQ
jgi:hypothetical protein